MGQFEVTYQLKDMFFDRAAVINSVSKAQHRQLSRIGAFIQRTASKSILRRRKKSSKPGQAPSVHSTDSVATLKNIIFGLDPSALSVVIGPVKLNQVNLTDDGSVTVPALHEFGGHVNIHEEQYKQTKTPERWFRRDFRQSKKPWKQYRVRRAIYPARPFMKPALDKEVAKGTLKDIWVGALSSSPFATAA